MLNTIVPDPEPPQSDDELIEQSEMENKSEGESEIGYG